MHPFLTLKLFFYIGLSLLIAHYLGRKRQIGFKLSLFFSLTLTPFFGFIITMVSSKYYSDNPKPSLSKKIFGWVFIFFAAMAFYGSSNNINYTDLERFTAYGVQFGLAYLGYYMIQRGNGKRFDDLMKVEKNNDGEAS